MKRNMLEKDPWPHTPHDVFAASYDGETGKDMSSLAFDDARISSHCFKSSNVSSNIEFYDHTLNGTSSGADSNSYTYQLSHTPQTDDLNIFNSSYEDKESSDLLYYGWPDIGNFEDVDRMLRSCDSSFGLGNTGNNNEMDWFTLEDSIVGCEEVLTTDFKFPCSQPSALINMSEDYEPPESDYKRSSYVFENKDEFELKDQGVESKGVVQLRNGREAHFKKDNRMVNLQKKQSNHHQTEGKKASQCLGHDGNQQQKRNSELDSFGYMQNNTYLQPNYGHAPNQTTAGPVLTGMKSENKGLTSPSTKESSYVLNQVHSMESSGDPSLQGTAVKVDRREVHQTHGFQTSFAGSPRQISMMLQSSKCDPVSAQKQIHMSTNELENQSDLEGFQKGASAEIGSLNVLDSSSISSGLDDISLEATSFRQLQQVMEHLDLRMKVCIKHSLYRLARSAEQRQSHAGVSGSAADYGDTGWPLMTEGTKKCTEFLDMQIDTNPIDRSIAHLLFHRPSKSSNLPASLKPSTTMHGFLTSPLVVAIKLDCQEEAANESADKVVDD